MRKLRRSLINVVQGKAIGHPSHVLFVHHPGALFPTSLIFDILSHLMEEPSLVKAALYNVAAGLGFALFAVVTGFVDYFGMISGSAKHRVGTRHWMVILTAIALFSLSLGFRAVEFDAPRTPWYIIGISFAATPMLLLGEFFGGELVYRMGMRVSTRGPRTPLETLIDLAWNSVPGLPGRRRAPREDAESQREPVAAPRRE